MYKVYVRRKDLKASDCTRVKHKLNETVPAVAARREPFHGRQVVANSVALLQLMKRYNTRVNIIIFCASHLMFDTIEH